MYASINTPLHDEIQLRDNNAESLSIQLYLPPSCRLCHWHVFTLCLSLGGHLFLSISIYLTLSVILPSSQLCSVSRSAVSQSSQSILSCTNAEPLHIHKGTDSSGLLDEDLPHAACLLPGVQASDMAEVCLADLFTLSLVIYTYLVLNRHEQKLQPAGAFTPKSSTVTKSYKAVQHLSSLCMVSCVHIRVRLPENVIGSHSMMSVVTKKLSRSSVTAEVCILHSLKMNGKCCSSVVVLDTVWTQPKDWLVRVWGGWSCNHFIKVK